MTCTVQHGDSCRRRYSAACNTERANYFNNNYRLQMPSRGLLKLLSAGVMISLQSLAISAFAPGP